MFSVCIVCTSGLSLKNLKRHKKHKFIFQEKWILRLAFNPGFAPGTGRFRATRQPELKFRLRFLPPSWSWMGKLTITYAKKWANRMKEVLTRTMSTFTSFSILVIFVSKSTRAFEWSFGITAFRIWFVSTSMASSSTQVDIWKVQRNSNIADKMIQIRRALITLGLDMWPLQLYIFDLIYWQVMTPYSCFFSTRDCKYVQANRWHHLAESCRY